MSFFCINCQKDFQTDEERQLHSAVSCPAIIGSYEEEEVQPPCDVLTQEITGLIEDPADGPTNTEHKDEGSSNDDAGNLPANLETTSAATTTLFKNKIRFCDIGKTTKISLFNIS